MPFPEVFAESVATANPPLFVTQAEAFQYYDRIFQLAADERELYRRLLLEGTIRGRYIGMDCPEQAIETDPDKLNARYLKYGRMIGAEAVGKALDAANLQPADIGGLVLNSCTGYLCPGLTSYLAEDVGLPDDLRHMDLVGMGCGGALPNVFAAAGMLAAEPEKPVLSVAVEICSATLFMGEDPGLVVSNSIFGDGASCVVLRIDHWAVHPGGTAVLKSVSRKFELDDDALRNSHHVFRNYGNMSSPSVIFVLKRIMDEDDPQPGEIGLLLSFGAGFSAFAMLVGF